jgi:hypothetical protein
VIKLATIRHQVAILGRVTDAQTRQPVAGARVTITAGPPEFLDRLKLLADVARQDRAQAGRQPDFGQADRSRVDQAVARPDGHYHYLNLPAGTYTVSATAPAAGTRYGSSPAVQVTVAADAQGKITPGTADLALPPTGVKGKITTQVNAVSTSLSMAEVRVHGSGERVYTNSNGEYLLLGLETGKRTVRFGARNYQPDVRAVDLPTPGALATVDVVLVLSPP